MVVPDARDMAFLPEFGYLTLANALQEWTDARTIEAKLDEEGTG